MSNVVEYIKNKLKKENSNTIEDNKKPLETNITENTTNNSRKKSSTAKRAIATALTVGLMASSATACSNPVQDFVDDLLGTGTNPPVSDKVDKDTIGSNNNGSSEDIKVPEETVIVPEGDQITSEELIDSIESALESKYNLSDIELEAIATVLHDGKIMPQYIQGMNGKMIFVKYTVNENGNSFDLNIPVPIDDYTKAAKVVSPRDNVINITVGQLPNISNTVLASLDEMTTSAMNPSQEMGN